MLLDWYWNDPRIICTYYKIGCYKAALWHTAHTERRTEAEMEPDGERVRRWGWVGSADISRGEKTYLQRGLLRAVNVHIPSFWQK